MPATVEITGCTIRCGPEHKCYGDPWDWRRERKSN